MRLLTAIVILYTAVLLAGCPKKPTTAPDSESGSAVAGEAAGATTGGAGEAGVGEARPLPGAEGTGAAGGAAAAGAGRIVYFDFDSSDIRPEYAGLIAAEARRLAASPGLKIRLAGHTDERGSREYNIALGERRAQAVRRALLLQGVADAQVVTVSYGEEQPAAEGSDEPAYQQNRRVEFSDAG